MNLRLYYEKIGGHVHCRLFSASEPHLTHGHNGNLVFDEREWPYVQDRFARIAEVFEERKNVYLKDSNE